MAVKSSSSIVSRVIVPAPSSSFGPTPAEVRAAIGERPWLRPSPLEVAGLPLPSDESDVYDPYGKRFTWTGSGAVALLDGLGHGAEFADACERAGAEFSPAALDADDERVRVVYEARQDWDAYCPLGDWSIGFNVAVCRNHRNGAPDSWEVSESDAAEGLDADDVGELLRDGSGRLSDGEISDVAVIRWLSARGCRGITGGSIHSHSGEWIGGLYGASSASGAVSSSDAHYIAGGDFVGYVTPGQILDEFVLPGASATGHGLTGVIFWESDAARWVSEVDCVVDGVAYPAGSNVSAVVEAWASARVKGFFDGPLDDYVRGNVFVAVAEVEVDSPSGGFSGETALGGVFGDDVEGLTASYGESVAVDFLAEQVAEAWHYATDQAARVAVPEYVI